MKLSNKVRVDYDADSGRMAGYRSRADRKMGRPAFSNLAPGLADKLGSGGFEMPSFIEVDPKADIEAVGFRAWNKATRDAPSEMITDVVVSELQNETTAYRIMTSRTGASSSTRTIPSLQSTRTRPGASAPA